MNQVKTQKLEVKTKPRVDTRKRTYDFALNVIKFIDKLPKDISSQTIARQLLRSATSIGANVIEAKASSSRRDYTNFFTYSLKSANETKYWLNLLNDSGKCDHQSVELLIRESDEISRILGSSILTLKSKNGST